MGTAVFGVLGLLFIEATNGIQYYQQSMAGAVRLWVMGKTLQNQNEFNNFDCRILCCIFFRMPIAD